MPRNFIPCDRDQELLLPPNMMEWLPKEHLVHFVIDAVDQLDLSDFYGRHREDGHGRAAFEPRMMVTLLLYAYAIGVRSAREIERRLTDDVACRVISADQRIDHSTICRFRARYRAALSELFVAVLGLCGDAGMLRPGVVAIDGTKLAADASPDRNLTKAQLAELAEQILSDAERIDQQEDELYGARRGDEIPEQLLDRAARIEFLKRRLAERQAADDAARKPSKRRPARINTTDPDSALQKVSGGYLQGYNGQLAVTLEQIIIAADLSAANNDVQELEPMVTQAQANLDALEDGGSIDTVVADAGYFSEDNAALELGVELLLAPVAGRTLDDAIAAQQQPGAPGVAEELRARRAARARQRAARRAEIMDGYIAGQVTGREAAAALGVSIQRIHWLKWHHKKFGWLPPARQPAQPPQPTAKQIMIERFARPGAKATYDHRAKTIEPVFGQLKELRNLRRLVHRGREACSCEFRMMATAHNLRKLWVGRLRGGLSSPIPA